MSKKVSNPPPPRVNETGAVTGSVNHSVNSPTIYQKPPPPPPPPPAKK